MLRTEAQFLSTALFDETPEMPVEHLCHCVLHGGSPSPAESAGQEGVECGHAKSSRSLVTHRDDH